MALPTIVTRTSKGSALSFAEADANFTNLRDAVITVTDGSTPSDIALNGTLSFTAGTGISLAQTGGTLTITNTVTDTDTGILNVVEDTTPQLGGALDAQGNTISNPVFKDYAETIHALGSTDTPTITIGNGNVQSVTISAGLTLPAFSDAATGQSVTLIVSGSGTASGTANHKFAGGNTTLTTLSVVSIFYDGTNYYTSIATDFQ